MRCAVVGCGPVGRFLGARLGLEPLHRDQLPSGQIDLVFLAVPDRCIADQADRLRRAGNWALVHCSGATSLATLGDGANAVWHPMRAFADRAQPPDDLANCVVGLRGDAALLAWLELQTQAWGGQPVLVDEDQAVRVHAACCFAAGFCASVAGHAVQIFEQAGLSVDQARQAVEALSDSAITAMLSGQGLTGPALRDDLETIRAHLQQLDTRGELYRALTQSMAAHGSISDRIRAGL